MKDAFGWINKIKDLVTRNAMIITSENIRKLDADRVTLIERIINGEEEGLFYQEVAKSGDPSLEQRRKLLFNNRTQLTDLPVENGTFIEPNIGVTTVGDLGTAGPIDVNIIGFHGHNVEGLITPDFEVHIHPPSKLTIPAGEVDLGAIADGEFLKRVGTDIVGAAGRGGGEVNTASNLGPGVGVFKQKVGVDLEFKTLISPTSTISIVAPGGAAQTVQLEVGPHNTSHQNGGSDEINVAGLSGILVDKQNPTAHAASHQNAGVDEISVLGLSGLLADDQTPLTHDIITKHNGFPGDSANFLRADGTWNPPPGGGGVLTTLGDLLTHDGGNEVALPGGSDGDVLKYDISAGPFWTALAPSDLYISRITGTSGAMGAFETWLVLTAPSGNITGVALVTVMTITGVNPGRYKVTIQLIYQTTNVGTGIDVAVNHTGTISQWIMEHRFSSTGGAAATAAASESVAAATGNLYESQGNRTVAGKIGSGTVSVDFANTNMMSTIEGYFVVTAVGNLQVQMSAEAAGLVCTAREGSNIVLKKLS